MTISCPRQLALAVILGLAACVEPANRCAIPETRDLKTINTLIADTEATIARGYVMKTGDRSGINFCLGGHRSNVGLSYCTDPVGRSQPVAIDDAAEQRKLAALRARRAALLETIRIRTAACNLQG